MNLILLFPDLQNISRKLREHSSKLKFSYSETTIRIQAPVDSPGDTIYANLIWLAITVVASVIAFVCKEYGFGIMSILTGLGSALYTYMTRNKPPDLKTIRLQNKIVVDTLAQQIIVEHLHPYYQQQVAKTTLVAFSQVQKVKAYDGARTEEHKYGLLCVELTDDVLLYLAEVETMNTTQSLARVLQQILGLPVDPEPKAWWQF
ncbi:hypothetical protein [Hymenobacter metallilatus]|uniref:Uncharacterized protein n=1 Tax=Hymenobacter metallilatus TaxID=2493666 RepID=A0A428JMM3_9BACT|nr:hypothetical protein [Hymenobacter metallilatus]RSK34492.1 hypothetical protein EI290_07630 [Hymenobacter metallilatus]